MTNSKETSMGLKTCMNILCGTTSCADWKTGWSLRSGDLANLCHKCGSTFEKHSYCEEFHADDSGWRECVTCGKRLHCGCIASLSLIELLDGGGVKCIGCARNLCPDTSFGFEKCDGSGPCTLSEENNVVVQSGKYKDSNGNHPAPMIETADRNTGLGCLKKEVLLPFGEFGSAYMPNSLQSVDLFQKARVDFSTVTFQPKSIYAPVAHPNLNITLGAPAANLYSSSGVVIDEGDQRKISNSFDQGFDSHQPSPSPSKFGISPLPEAKVTVMPPSRVARPPVDGRGRHHLLPRYWPRITDQELQQITGDSNCTIVPLFEKVLSASDAGRIGRLVLPKACAEAYFPPISQPEGLPMKIQDMKGKEWIFQFRFWPNNNSRMYVLEGVTPCIQSMQLEAGDTVIFSRMDPEGKLVMGFRKSSNPVAMQKMKVSSETHSNSFSQQLDAVNGNIKWQNGVKYGEGTEESILSTSMLMQDRKKSRNISSKNKRLLIDSQDVWALRLTWDEVQGLLRPPRTVTPSVVVVEDYEIEEYEEPPVFGKSTIFTARSSGVIEQWAQCDNCGKWRRLPGDVLLPPKWSCAENAWDKSRCSCSAPDELSPADLNHVLQISRDSKKRRMFKTSKMVQEKPEAAGLDALASAATLRDSNTNDPGSSTVATTTRHPRHRPGCSCIVCIQPPSGKGKHKSTCTCTVCMTVKRRFKTLMMRKKKRQSEQEAELALRNHQCKEDGEKVNQSVRLLDVGPASQIDSTDELTEDGKGHDVILGNQTAEGGTLNETGKSLDLNCHPERREALSKVGAGPPSLSGLLQFASLPMEDYMRQNGLASLNSESEALAATMGRLSDDLPIVNHNFHEQFNPGDGTCALECKQQNDPM